jgi:protein-L-isoaspartate(D-aspartate) O-methyltransferase
MVRVQLAARGVRDRRVLEVMGRVPRHRFVPEAYREDAYADQALPLRLGQTISQPYMVAHMTELLDVQPGMRVLEVGTGSGYQCSVLASLGGRVHSIERLAELAAAAEWLLGQLGVTGVVIHRGDGSAGLAAEAPFDRILVTAGAPDVPQSLVEQLAMGGRLVVPVGRPGMQMLVRVDRRPGRIVETPGLACRFVKLVGAQGWPSDSREALSSG